MRPFALLLLMSAAAIAQDFVRPWVVPPPKAAVPTMQFRAPDDVPPPSRPAPLLLPAEFPFPIVLTPCTWFPGNPVFVIEGGIITMRKASDR